MVVMILLAGVPVYRLTRPAQAEAAANATVAVIPADPVVGKPAPLEIEAVFAPAATDFQLRNLGQTVLAGQGPQARFRTRWTTAVPPEGLDLVLQAHWSALAAAAEASTGINPAAAARVTLRFADGQQVEKSFWAGANGTLTEVFTVPGEHAVDAP